LIRAEGQVVGWVVHAAVGVGGDGRRVDGVRVDSVRVDSVRVDSVRVDSVFGETATRGAGRFEKEM